VVAAGGGGEGAADAFVELEHISSVELLRVVAGGGGAAAPARGRAGAWDQELIALIAGRRES
jgi:hypothetical protein